MNYFISSICVCLLWVAACKESLHSQHAPQKHQQVINSNTNNQNTNHQNTNNKNTNNSNIISQKVTHNIPTDFNNYTFIGRFDTQDPNGPRFAWSNSEIHANVQNTTSVSVVLTETIFPIAESSGINNDYFNIVIDGNQTMILTTLPGYNTYTLATGLDLGPHTIELHKRTEFREAVAQFGGFYLNANGTFLQPPSPPNRHLLFVGTSGFTGYGIELDVVLYPTPDTCPVPITPITNADLGIPKLIGNILQADIMNISSSGCGIHQSAYHDPLLPLEFNEILPSAIDESNLPAFNSPWNPNMNPNTIPSAIIIEAGGDDLDPTYGQDGNFVYSYNTTVDTPIFVNDFVSFIKTMQSYYPNTPIVILMVPSAYSGQYALLYTALNEVVAQSGPNVVYYNIFENDPNNNCATVQPVQYNYACGNQGTLKNVCWHPDPTGTAYMARILAGYLKTKLNW